MTYPLFKVNMRHTAGEAVGRVLDSGYIGQGEVTDRFEQAFSGYAPYPIVSVNSCTSAIQAVLMHLGVGPGDEVITTPITCIATNAPIKLLGAKIIWADVHSDTGNIDANDVAKKVTVRTKAIIAVDWAGRPCDYPALRALGVPVIQDAAHGPMVNKEESHHGHYVCYSFGPIKHLTTGDGGAISTKRVVDREALKLIRWYGLDRTSLADFRCAQDIQPEFFGMKLHMTDINAAIGLANLSNMQETIAKHKRHAMILWSNFYSYGFARLLPPWSSESQYWVFPILLKDRAERDRLKARLEKAGIAASQVHARNDLHTAYHDPSSRSLPGVESFDDRQLNIPCGWWLSRQDLDTIASTVAREL